MAFTGHATFISRWLSRLTLGTVDILISHNASIFQDSDVRK